MKIVVVANVGERMRPRIGTRGACAPQSEE
jgi:hypothetical protein